jgi:hypothetical protein
VQVTSLKHRAGTELNIQLQDIDDGALRLARRIGGNDEQAVGALQRCD